MISLIVDLGTPDIIESCRTEMFLSYIISLNNIFMILSFGKSIFIILEINSSGGGDHLSHQREKEDVIQNKKKAIRSLNNLLEYYINEPSGKFLKKADLISFWLSTYSQYLKSENTFNPTKLPSFKRGNVLKVNFGFNARSEHGGLHYAVVMDNDNLHNSPVVTVIPLSSGTEDTVYERDVYLGTELYTKLKLKSSTIQKNTREKLNYNQKILEALKNSGNITDESFSKVTSEVIANIRSASADIALIEKYNAEISKMKQGSIALIEQVRTVSKQRIYVPRSSSDILYGISLSAEAMSAINEQFIKLFTFQNKC